jgi:uncharacterized protein
VPKPTVVLDTNVYISSFFWEGNPANIVRNAISGKYQVHVSRDIIKEIETVLKRDFRINSGEVKKILGSISSFAKFTNPTRSVDIIKEDEADNRILECGIACGARYIVTGDQHLLKVRMFEGIQIVLPNEFLKILK